MLSSSTLIIKKLAKLIILNQLTKMLTDLLHHCKNALGIGRSLKRQLQRICRREFLRSSIPSSFAGWVILEIVQAPTGLVICAKDIQ
ncbi:hypothetical protein CEJ98_16940 [Burkholderia gladioli pv. gladioli]|nr:hypothetical protein CEJ98_16940 [Burkholderia gladioli pv. gladioli]AWY54267.1 hypothetical protein A8H28_24185 [Burkholderia gladioli pv. gladioli]